MPEFPDGYPVRATVPLSGDEAVLISQGGRVKPVAASEVAALAARIRIFDYPGQWTRVTSDRTLVVGGLYGVVTTHSRTLILPLLAGLSDGAAIRVADLKGLSETNPIVIIPAAGDKINDQLNNPITIASNRTVVDFVVNLADGTWDTLTLL